MQVLMGLLRLEKEISSYPQVYPCGKWAWISIRKGKRRAITRSEWKTHSVLTHHKRHLSLSLPAAGLVKRIGQRGSVHLVNGVLSESLMQMTLKHGLSERPPFTSGFLA